MGVIDPIKAFDTLCEPIQDLILDNTAALGLGIGDTVEHDHRIARNEAIRMAVFQAPCKLLLQLKS
jgi:hypothetical protein